MRSIGMISRIAAESGAAGREVQDRCRVFERGSIRVIEETELVAAGFPERSFFNVNTPQDRLAAEGGDSTPSQGRGWAGSSLPRDRTSILTAPSRTRVLSRIASIALEGFATGMETITDAATKTLTPLQRDTAQPSGTLCQCLRPSQLSCPWSRNRYHNCFRSDRCAHSKRRRYISRKRKANREDSQDGSVKIGNSYTAVMSLPLPARAS